MIDALEGPSSATSTVSSSAAAVAADARSPEQHAVDAGVAGARPGRKLVRSTQRVRERDERGAPHANVAPMAAAAPTRSSRRVSLDIPVPSLARRLPARLSQLGRPRRQTPSDGYEQDLRQPVAGVNGRQPPGNVLPEDGAREERRRETDPQHCSEAHGGFPVVDPRRPMSQASTATTTRHRAPSATIFASGIVVATAAPGSRPRSLVTSSPKRRGCTRRHPPRRRQRLPREPPDGLPVQSPRSRCPPPRSRGGPLTSSRGTHGARSSEGERRSPPRLGWRAPLLDSLAGS
jgi:hypothetical protein